MITTIRSLSVLALALLAAGCVSTETEPASSAAAGATYGPDYRNSSAAVVVLNFFDMYCPHCQTSAKYVNELHSMVRSRGQGSRIKFYAIGVNNTPQEANLYRTRFNVAYPVVPDRGRTISSRFGKVRPPLLIALRKVGGQWTEFYRTKYIAGHTDEIYARIQP